MTSPANPITEQETRPRFMLPACLHLPVMWALWGITYLAVRAGIIRFEPPAAPPQRLLGIFTNRYFRRAQAACIRRELARFKRTGQPITGLHYFPRRYAFMGFENLVTGAKTFQHYVNQCIRQFGLSRTVLLGLSSVARITAVIKALWNRPGLSLIALSALFGRGALSLAAPSDPAPP